MKAFSSSARQGRAMPAGAGSHSRSGLRRHRKALLNKRVEPVLAHALTPARQRRAIKDELVLEEFLAAKILKIRVLGPNLAQPLVREVLAVFQDPSAAWARADCRDHPNKPLRTCLRESPNRSAEPSARGWLMSMIWSSLVLNRSLCPVSRRSLGFIPVPASKSDAA